MDYVEFRRVRRALVIYAISLAIAAIVTVASIHAASVHALGGHVVIKMDSNAPSHGLSARDAMGSLRIPLGLLLGLAGYCAVVIATVFASSLNKENDGANFVFTKPISRERLALQYMAIDAAGILSAFAMACLAIFGSLAALGFSARISGDPQSLWIGALGLGIAFMWYGIMQAVTAAYRGKGGTLVGLSWAVFAILVGASSATFLGPVLAAIVRVLNIFNPIAYFTALVTADRGVIVESIIGTSIQSRVAIAWSIALVACALAIRIWKRVEV